MPIPDKHFNAAVANGNNLPRTYKMSKQQTVPFHLQYFTKNGAVITELCIELSYLTIVILPVNR